MHEASDSALWLEASSGTERSFAVLFDRYRTRVFRKAYAQVRSVADAEDVVALVFLEAWRNRAKVRIVDGSLLPWLLTVTNYVLLNQARTARRYGRLLAAMPSPEQEPDHADDVLDRLDRDGQLVAIRAAMRRLSAQEQAILDLCVIEELPIATAAAVLDIPTGTVKSKLHRAKEKLRKHLPARSTAMDLTARLDGAQP
ncbi:RNA polymerase sigma factor [Leifsonia sp. NPDC077715]|uniref:RNA polymerase sigma factor n=1 Tax=Leifsonia sp. NPDC077715 TaxID=3155539 RepID=UPI003441C45A